MNVLNKINDINFELESNDSLFEKINNIEQSRDDIINKFYKIIVNFKVNNIDDLNSKEYSFIEENLINYISQIGNKEKYIYGNNFKYKIFENDLKLYHDFKLH